MTKIRERLANVGDKIEVWTVHPYFAGLIARQRRVQRQALHSDEIIAKPKEEKTELIAHALLADNKAMSITNGYVRAIVRKSALERETDDCIILCGGVEDDLLITV